MDRSKASGILVLFTFALSRCHRRPGQSHHSYIAAASSDHEKNRQHVDGIVNLWPHEEKRGQSRADDSSITPFVANEHMRQLTSISHHLRGGADPSDLLDKVQNIMKSQHESVQSIRKMHQDGDEKGLTYHVKSVIEEAIALKQAETDNLDTDLTFPVPDFTLNAMSKLEDIPNSQFLTFFEPQLFDNIANQVQEVVAFLDDVKSIIRPSVASQRQLKANLSPFKMKNGQDPFPFVQNPTGFRRHKKSGRDQSRNGNFDWKFDVDQNKQRSYSRSRGGGRFHLPDISKFIHTGSDAESGNRWTKVNERHTRRLESMDVCNDQGCTSNNATCHCDRLSGCISDMSDYDIALLFVGEYIETDPSSDQFASFEEGLYFYDADFNIVQKIERVRDLASRSDCENLLPELHSACNPLQDSCSGTNRNSFQLSIDDVCDAANRPTKLLFSSISDDLDGYWGEDGLESSLTSCGNQRLAFASCLDFVEEFDLLYQGRDLVKYPDWNPMRLYPDVAPDKNDFIRYPTRYNFKRSVHGIDELASMYDKIRLISSIERCMDAPNDGSNNVNIADCKSGSSSQDFFYESSTHRIRLRRNGHCLHYNYRNRLLYVRVCNQDDNQKWYFDVVMQQLKSFRDGYCMEGGSVRPYMHICYDGDNQKFIIPSRWLHGISFDRIQAVSDPDLCMEVVSSSKLQMVTCDHGKASQVFVYNALTKEVKQGGRCMDYHLTQYYVYMYTCHGQNNQKWYLETAVSRLRTGWDNKCLDWDGTKLYMTTCAPTSSQKFQLPRPWWDGISTSSFDEVRAFSSLQLCMTLIGMNSTVAMSKCEDGNKDQRLYYDMETFEIKFSQSSKCVDYNYHTREVYMHSCHGGHNQKWYHYRASNYLKSFHDNKCMGVTGDKLMMNECQFQDSQKFIVPAAWSTNSFSLVRSLNNFTKCMVYDPDQSNNVLMDECDQTVGLGQVIQYNPFTFEISLDGLCLDIVLAPDQYDTSEKLVEGNVIVWTCNGGRNQKWTFSPFTNRIQTVYGVCSFGNQNTPCCLELDEDGNIHGRICSSERSQMFLSPESWTIEQAASETNYPYYHRAVTPAIWSRNVCPVDLLQDTIKTCDASMSLLLGVSTSLGTLRTIAKLVNEKGPERMPGTCCLDSPLTSESFGFHFDPTTMICQNPGPWHLGITAEACENAMGRWFRSPCVTLKECIDARPLNGTTHYSQSFEDFAKKLVIIDPNVESRCGVVREELGFESDYPFDTEVCQKFESFMCDKFFTEMDDLLDNTDVPSFESIIYEDIVYPENPPLSFEMLPERLEGTNYEAFQVPQFGTQAGLNKLQDAVIGTKHAKFVTDEGWDRAKELDPCKSIPATPFDIVKALCYVVRLVLLVIVYVIKFAMAVAHDTVSSVYEKATLSPSDVMDAALRVETLFDNFQSFDSWSTVAFGTLNSNMMIQHTEMREQLQDRHNMMVNDINDWTKSVGNVLGKHTTDVGNTLGAHHLSLQNQLIKIDDRLNDVNSSCVKRSSWKRSINVRQRTLSRQVPKMSCGFNLPFASGLKMKQEENSTLFVEEDISASMSSIPLVLLAQDNIEANMTVEVSVLSNAAIAGSKKTVLLLHELSSRQLVPFILPHTCPSLNTDVCDQSGEDYILYEFSFVAVDQSGARYDPVVCNVVVHGSSQSPSVRSNVRFELLPATSFPLTVF